MVLWWRFADIQEEAREAAGGRQTHAAAAPGRAKATRRRGGHPDRGACRVRWGWCRLLQWTQRRSAAQLLCCFSSVLCCLETPFKHQHPLHPFAHSYTNAGKSTLLSALCGVSRDEAGVEGARCSLLLSGAVPILIVSHGSGTWLVSEGAALRLAVGCDLQIGCSQPWTPPPAARPCLPGTRC